MKRLTRKEYDTAKRAVKRLAAYQKKVETWEAAVHRLGDYGDQVIMAIKFDKDGNPVAECQPRERAQSSPTSPQQAVGASLQNGNTQRAHANERA